MSAAGPPQGAKPGVERERAEQVPSPCISVCVMDADGSVCLGCFRTLDEIASWGALDANARRRVLAALPAREAMRRAR